MKKIFILSALAIAAIGCTKSEVVEAPESFEAPIMFETYIGRAPVTKAESVDLAYLQGENRGFHVYAFLHRPVGSGEQFNAMALNNTPYMDKYVWWEANDEVTGIPEEAENTKVIFHQATEEESIPEVTTISGETFTLPEGWTDDYQYNSAYYVVYTLTSTESDGSTTKSWTPGTVTEITSPSNASGDWMYDGVTYWPTSNHLAFMAYGVNTKITGETPTESHVGTFNGETKTLTFNVEDKVADQKDLIVAPFQYGRYIDNNQTNTKVALNFKHVLSRVGFSLVANQTSELVEIIITKVDISGDFISNGTVDLTKAVPEIVPTTATAASDASESGVTYTLLPESYGFKTTSKETAEPIYINTQYENATGEDNPYDIIDYVKVKEGVTEEQIAANLKNRYMMLMPNSKTDNQYDKKDYTITVDYQLKDAEPQTATINLNSWAFEAGKSYDFVMKVSTSAIGFYVQVSDWNEYFPTTETPGDNSPVDQNGIINLTPDIE